MNKQLKDRLLKTEALLVAEELLELTESRIAIYMAFGCAWTIAVSIITLFVIRTLW